MSGQFENAMTVQGISIPMIDAPYRKVISSIGGQIALDFQVQQGIAGLSPTTVSQQQSVFLEFAAFQGSVESQTHGAQAVPVFVEYQVFAGSAGPKQSIVQEQSIFLDFAIQKAAIAVVGAEISQLTPVELEFELQAGSVEVLPLSVDQSGQVELEFSLLSGTVTTTPQIIVQLAPAVLEYVVLPGAAGRATSILGGVALLEFAANQGIVTVSPTVVSQQQPAVLEFVVLPGTVITDPLAVIQNTPIQLDFLVRQGTVTLSPTDVIQHTQIVLQFDAYSATAQFDIGIAQSAPIQLEYSVLPGVVSVLSQVTQGNPIVLDFVVQAGTATRTEETFVTGGQIELEFMMQIGQINIGQIPACVWWAPRDCSDSVVAAEIIHKQPSEDMWLAFDFGFRLEPGEIITQVLGLDDQGSGVINTPPTVESSLPSRVKYGVINGVDGENVRIEHRVRTSQARELEGDGYLYIRDRKY